jgi:hypothetical protein
MRMDRHRHSDVRRPAPQFTGLRDLRIRMHTGKLTEGDTHQLAAVTGRLRVLHLEM